MGPLEENKDAIKVDGPGNPGRFYLYCRAERTRPNPYGITGSTMCDGICGEQ